MKFASIFIMTILLSVQACDKTKTATEKGPKLGETIELKLEDNVKVAGENLELTFVSLQESRCPQNTNCIRAGEAIATLQISHNGKKESVTLQSKGFCLSEKGECGQSKTVGDYRIQLLNIFPYPGVSDTKEKVFMKMIVSKAGAPTS